MSRDFAMAPMSTAIRVLTWIAMAVPLAMLAGALLAPRAGSLSFVALLVIMVYAVIYLVYRPTAFRVSPAGLTLIFPLRTRQVPAGVITGAEPVDTAGFKARFGWALRVGAGGLWGGFGRLYTREGWVTMYISSTDQMVLVTIREGPPLLISPGDPEGFCAAVGELVEGSAGPTARRA